VRVLVTGGTGYVGSHTAAASFAAGHDVRLLARHPESVAPALLPVGVDPTRVDVAVGDLLHAGQPRWDGAGPFDVLGVEWRTSETSLGDTVAWLYAEGHLSSRQAGRATTPTEPQRPAAA
jgi:nucleoside-diphosphate-sugar epimerase